MYFSNTIKYQIMKKVFLLIIIIGFFHINKTVAHFSKPTTFLKGNQESPRIKELDQYWKESSRTVREGDFEGYKASYHKDAVVVFAVGENKTTVSIAKALENWKQGFSDTKEGKVEANVEFRFSQRIGDETTAHETGIFHYTSKDSDGKINTDVYINFEMLFVKQNGKWLGLMENQKSVATKEDWEALKK